MSVSANLEIPELAEGQANKTAAFNYGMSRLEGALSGITTIDTSAATSAGFDITIPYDGSNDISPRPALHSLVFRLGAGATAAFDLIHPDNPHLFIVDNATAHTVTVKTAAGTGVDVATATAALVYCDGTNVINIVGPSAFAEAGGGEDPATIRPEDFHIAVFNGIEPDTTIAAFILPREITFAADFGGSVGRCDTPPASAEAIEVFDDGVEIGTINITTGGVVTFVTTLNEAKVVAAESLLTVEVPSGTVTFNNLYINLVGSSALPIE